MENTVNVYILSNHNQASRQQRQAPHPCWAAAQMPWVVLRPLSWPSRNPPPLASLSDPLAGPPDPLAGLTDPLTGLPDPLPGLPDLLDGLPDRLH